MWSGDLNLGARYGRLVVGWLDRVHVTPGGKKKPMMACRCDCGGIHVASLFDIRAGKTASCGCGPRNAPTTHGASRGGRLAPEYRSWRNMLTRARNPNIWCASRYVLRGITVAPEWLPGGDGRGYERFLAHVGPRPSEKHSLDRIDNDAGYVPGNVRWATQAEQVRNRAVSRR